MRVKSGQQPAPAHLRAVPCDRDVAAAAGGGRLPGSCHPDRGGCQPGVPAADDGAGRDHGRRATGGRQQAKLFSNAESQGVNIVHREALTSHILQVPPPVLAVHQVHSAVLTHVC